MGKDFEVRELLNGSGSGRFQVTATLSHSNLSLGRELIRTGALSKSGDLTFQLIGDQPCVVFTTFNGTNYEIYPLISQAKGIFNTAITSALRLKRIIEAIELAETSKEETR